MSADLAPTVSRRGRTLTIATLLVVVLAVAGGVWWWRAHRNGIEFSARFTAAVGVYAGSDVRILGVPVGQVDSVTPHGTYVVLAMHLDPGVPVRSDTAAVIVSPNLVSDRYVQLTGAWDGGPKLADHATIPRSSTATPVELDELTRNLTQLSDALGPNGANKQGALSRLLKVGAANLKGTGAQLNRTITNLSESGRTLDSAKDDIFATIDQLSTFTGTLRDHDSALDSANRGLASVSQTLADDRQTFAQALRELGGALSLVQRFVRDNRSSLAKNVDRLSAVAQTLAKQRTSLAQALRSAPALLQNFLNAYDGKHNLLRGRADLNELTVWANGGSGSSAASSSAVSRSASASAVSADAASVPPLLLPSVGNPVVTG